MDLACSFSLRSASMTLVNGANNDVTNPGVATVEITAPSGSFSITGITGGTEGQKLTINNLSSQQMTLSHQNTSSTATNRFICPGATDLVLAGTSGGIASVEIIYSSSQSRWLVIHHVP